MTTVFLEYNWAQTSPVEELGLQLTDFHPTLFEQMIRQRRKNENLFFESETKMSEQRLLDSIPSAVPH